MQSKVSVKISNGSYLIKNCVNLLRLAKESEEKCFSVPIFMTLAVTLESILNDAIVEYCQNHYFKDDSRTHAESFLSMNLKSKLITIISLVSNNEFVIDKQSTVFQDIRTLISKRNEIAHTKAFYEDVELEHQGGGGDTKGVAINSSWYNKQMSKPLFSISLEDIDRTLLAIEELHQFLKKKPRKASYEEFSFIKLSKGVTRRSIGCIRTARS